MPRCCTCIVDASLHFTVAVVVVVVVVVAVSSISEFCSEHFYLFAARTAHTTPPGQEEGGGAKRTIEILSDCFECALCPWPMAQAFKFSFFWFQLKAMYWMLYVRLEDYRVARRRCAARERIRLRSSPSFNPFHSSGFYLAFINDKHNECEHTHTRTHTWTANFSTKFLLLAFLQSMFVCLRGASLFLMCNNIWIVTKKEASASITFLCALDGPFALPPFNVRWELWNHNFRNVFLFCLFYLLFQILLLLRALEISHRYFQMIVISPSFIQNRQ